MGKIEREVSKKNHVLMFRVLFFFVSKNKIKKKKVAREKFFLKLDKKPLLPLL